MSRSIEPLRIKLVRIQDVDILKFGDKMCSADCTHAHVHLLGIVWAKNCFYLKLAHRGEAKIGLNWLEHLF